MPAGLVGAERFVAGSVEVASGAVVVGRFVFVRAFVRVGLVVRTVDAGRVSSGVPGVSAALPPWDTVVTVLPPPPTNEMFDLNNALHVRASTEPVTGSP
jgi:hypothetical protein